VSQPSTAAQAAVVALVVGLLLGLALGPVIPFPFSGNASPGGQETPDPNPGYTVGKGTGCYDGPRENAGWVHVVANGETYAVTLNVTVVHDAGDVETDVFRRPTGEYELALTTTGSPNDRKGGGTACRAATSLDLATGLPYPEFVVTLDGRQVLTVEQDETVANLYPLPEPLNATESASSISTLT
jgi:hypothetical protein